MRRLAARSFRDRRGDERNVALAHAARRHPLDPLSFGAAAVIEIAVALLACAMPAFRATQSDPMVALRSE